MTSRDDDYAVLFRSEYPRLVRQVTLVVGDVEDAKEIAQEALERLYSRWSEISELDRPGAWARRVALRMALRTRRRGISRRSLEALATAGGVVAPPLPSDALDVWQAVSTLPAMQR